ncbi:hypothetical protein BC938DRAFT_474275 [Jimgerdemannia flammicorona]|uniref:C2H2-type domain-containing protein n=1 Tax=Jimgerdemannia flammicorona TaxID=994334 RepID=A0A433QZI1_9FUNG|nr:hypothetical protein BC938DRAFT_474275 [Jimgerdemannia flammicorona]
METGTYYHTYRYGPSAPSTSDPYAPYPFHEGRSLPSAPLPQLHHHTQPPPPQQQQQQLPPFGSAPQSSHFAHSPHGFYPPHEQAHYDHHQQRSSANSIPPLLPPLVTHSSAFSTPASNASHSQGPAPYALSASSSHLYARQEPSAPLAIPRPQYLGKPAHQPAPSSPDPPTLYGASFSNVYTPPSSSYTPSSPALNYHFSNTPPTADYPTAAAQPFYSLPAHHQPISEESAAASLALLSNPDNSRRDSLPIAALDAMSLNTPHPDHASALRRDHLEKPTFRRASIAISPSSAFQAAASSPIPIKGRHPTAAVAPSSVSPSSSPSGRPRRHSEHHRRSRIASFSESPKASLLAREHAHHHHHHHHHGHHQTSTSPPPSSSSSLRVVDRDQQFRCDDCGKAYKHPNCLAKHRWEHSPMWGMASKFLLSKHQQVQLMEAAAILVGMDRAAREGEGVGRLDETMSMGVGVGVATTVTNGAA